MNDETKEVHVKCRRGSDKVTNGQNCNSMLAVNLSHPGSHIVSLKCVKCGFIWNVPVGGFTSI